jgi:phosphinothricin acetyltransferase
MSDHPSDPASADVVLRDPDDGDLPGLAAVYDHYVRTSHATFDTEPFGTQGRRAWFDAHRVDPRHLLVVADRFGEVVGYATSSPLRPKPAYLTSVETTVYLRPDAVGLGLGRRLYAELFARLEGQDLHRAFAGVALPNPQSVGLHLACGFTPLGTYHEVGRKHGRYWDVQWFERALG